MHVSGRVVFSLILGMGTAVALGDTETPKEAVKAETPSLKDVYKNDFYIGTCLGGKLPDSYPANEIDMIVKQYNAVTPENCMKPAPIHPEENRWDFEQPDALVKFAQDHNMVIYGHTLVWHNQTPAWFFKDGGQAASKELLLSRLKTHIDTEMGRYKGKIRAWDVVNEAINDNGTRDLRSSNWDKIIGDNFIEYAFQYAHEADPDAGLQYNDYNIEAGAATNKPNSKFDKALRLLKKLKADNVPITSVGIQGHWILDRIPFDDIDSAITQFSQLGLKVNITELDINIFSNQQAGGQFGAAGTSRPSSRPTTRRAPLTGAALADILKREGDQYGKLFAIFHKHHDVMDRVTLWGADDGHSWLNGRGGNVNYGLVFDRQLQPKPAFDAIIDVLSKPQNSLN